MAVAAGYFQRFPEIIVTNNRERSTRNGKGEGKERQQSPRRISDGKTGGDDN